jgi:hypothetical protein
MELSSFDYVCIPQKKLRFVKAALSRLPLL